MKGTAARTSGVPHFGSVIWTFTSVADTSPKGAHDEAVHFDVSGTISVQYDAERSAARLGERAEIASRARHAARGFDAYLARNGAKEEIARALAETPADLTMEIAKKRPAYIVTLSFHLRRNPEDVAAALFAARPDPDALPWFLRRSCEVSHGFPVAIAKHAPVPSARHLLAGCADERVRPALVAIAKGKDDLATTAKKTLASLDALKTPSKAFARNADESLVARGNDIMMAAILNDRRALVPALIAELEREPDTAAQWLEALTLAPLGKDPNAWRAFWATHEKLPASAWALEAAASPVATIRAVAYGVLATLPATEETRAVVARGLDDPRPRVKLAAAIALVSLGDDRGVAPLLALLEQGAAGERETALVALAPRMPVTFGFDPRAPEAERAEALARIRVWAEREGLRFP